MNDAQDRGPKRELRLGDYVSESHKMNFTFSNSNTQGSSSSIIIRSMTSGLFPQTFHSQCKYNIEPSLEIPATKSCGGLSMTKDNQDVVDLDENALKYLKPGFQK